MTTITDSIKNVAEALGFVTDSRFPVHSLRLPGAAWTVPWSALTQSDGRYEWVIVFAAHVKAAMAERGWLIGCDESSHLWFCTRTMITQEHGYVPTDPISEAHAIIRAAEEALGCQE